MQAHLLVIDKDIISELECPPEAGVAGWSGHNQTPYDGFIRWVDWDSYYEMWQVYVREEDREKGYGLRLMKRFEQMAKENKKVIYIHSTASKKEPFGNLLRKLKYKPVEEIRDNKMYEWKKSF